MRASGYRRLDLVDPSRIPSCYPYFSSCLYPQNQANSARVGDMVSHLNASLSFIPSEILDLPEGTIEKYLQEEPGLEPFRKHLSDLLETKPYRLSADTEAALAALGEVFAAPYTIYQRGKLSDMSFESVLHSPLQRINARQAYTCWKCQNSMVR